MSLDEKWKYDLCYERENYRMGPVRIVYAGDDIDGMVAPASYLDVGCGRGEMLDRAEKRGIEVQGVDFADDVCDGKRVIQADACALPFDDDQFDYVTCYDVLEHIPRTHDDDVLDEIKRVCRGVAFFSTNDRPSILAHPDHGQVDLHINKRPQADWHRKITDRWSFVVFSEKGHTRDWHWRCE